jgi:hypothetical protein
MDEKLNKSPDNCANRWIVGLCNPIIIARNLNQSIDTSNIKELSVEDEEICSQCFNYKYRKWQ